MEGEFAVKISEAQMAGIRTVEDLIRALRDEINSAPNGTEFHQLPAAS